MKQFYRIFSNEKVSTAWTQLTYSHLRLLFNIKFNCYVVVELKVNQNIFHKFKNFVRMKESLLENMNLCDLTFIKNNKVKEKTS